MRLRALLLCDDVRIELGGTLTAVGIRGDRIEVPDVEGPIVFPRMAVLTIVTDLLGVEWIACGQSLILPGDERERLIASDERHAHDPQANEHHFLAVLSPLELAGLGQYAIRLKLESTHGTLELDHGFELVPMDRRA